MIQKSVGKLAGLYVDQDVDEPKKKRSRVVKTERPSVMLQFRGVDLAAVRKAKIFGLRTVFMILSLYSSVWEYRGKDNKLTSSFKYNLCIHCYCMTIYDHTFYDYLLYAAATPGGPSFRRSQQRLLKRQQ